MHIALDPVRRRVKTIDESRSISFDGGIANLSWSFSFSRGVMFFEYEAGAAFGLLFKDGAWAVDRAYQYRFNLAEMKNPLIEATVMGGWSYAPSLTFVRWLGG